MKGNEKFTKKSSRFWAVVKIVSEKIGYSERVGKDKVSGMKRYTFEDIRNTFNKLEMPIEYCFVNDKPTSECVSVLEYLNYRADLIENVIRPLLMDREEAKKAYSE